MCGAGWIMAIYLPGCEKNEPRCLYSWHPRVAEACRGEPGATSAIAQALARWLPSQHPGWREDVRDAVLGPLFVGDIVARAPTKTQRVGCQSFRYSTLAGRYTRLNGATKETKSKLAAVESNFSDAMPVREPPLIHLHALIPRSPAGSWAAVLGPRQGVSRNRGGRRGGRGGEARIGCASSRALPCGGRQRLGCARTSGSLARLGAGRGG